MKQYHFKDVLYMGKGKVLPVENEKKESIGYIEKEDISGCEKGGSFSFTFNDGTTVVMRIEKRSIKNFLVATYIIKMEGKTYTLKDKAGNSLLYFCVVGEIGGKNIRIDENWSEEVEIKIDGTHIATIKPDDFSFKTRILLEENFDESSTFFAVSVLMCFMYKIYKKEAAFIENLISD